MKYFSRIFYAVHRPVKLTVPRSRKILPLAPVLGMMSPTLAFLRSPSLDNASFLRRPRSGPALHLVLGMGANTNVPCTPRNSRPVACNSRRSARASGLGAGLPKELFVQSVTCSLCADFAVEPCGEGPGLFQTTSINSWLQELMRTKDCFTGLPLPRPAMQLSVAGREAMAMTGGQPAAATGGELGGGTSFHAV